MTTAGPDGAERRAGTRLWSRRAVLLSTVSAAGTAALAACGGGGSDDPGDPGGPTTGKVTTGPDGAQEITVRVQDDYVFAPTAFTVAPGRVRITLTSDAQEMTHNILFTPGGGPVDIDEGIPVLPPGETDTVEFSVEQPGDYQYECSFHVRLGQIGTMTVA
ncbi:MAG: cupredoxin domain-containing protein [Blastococcus sp.]|nr:cupredoxin domain-containing protein [Blastococcus sp.]